MVIEFRSLDVGHDKVLSLLVLVGLRQVVDEPQLFLAVILERGSIGIKKNNFDKNNKEWTNTLKWEEGRRGERIEGRAGIGRGRWVDVEIGKG